MAKESGDAAQSKDAKKTADNTKEGKDSKDTTTDTASDATPAAPKLTPRQAATRDMKQAIELIQRAVDEEDFRLVARAVTKTKSIRRVLTAALLRPILEAAAPDLVATLDALAPRAVPGPAEAEEAREAAEKAAKEAEDERKRAELAAALEAANKDNTSSSSSSASSSASASATAMTDKDPASPSPDAAAATAEAALGPVLTKKPSEWAPEVTVFVSHLLAYYCFDHGLAAEAEAQADALAARVAVVSRHAMDWLSAAVYSLQTLAHDKAGKLPALRPALMAACSHATRTHNAPAQAVLTVAILRSFLLEKLYQQAEKFRANAPFPDESKCDTNTVARYAYYCGRIDAVQLKYTSAHANFTQALRKAPSSGAWGFVQAVQKHLILVELLLGNMPDRVLFNQKELRTALAPYARIAQAVRVGNVSAFNALLDDAALKERLEADGALSLVLRLRQNVIKTGLRKLTTSYSRMTLADVAARLSLPSAADAELLTAKAIHDGVVLATLDADAGCLTAKESTNLYATEQPKDAFLARIEYCLGVHEEATKALRYPASAGRDDDEDEATKAKKNKEAKEAIAKAQKERDAKSKDKDGKDKDGKKK